MEIDQN